MPYRAFAAPLLAAWLVVPTPAARAAEQVTNAALAFVSSAPWFIAQERGYDATRGSSSSSRFFRAAQI